MKCRRQPAGLFRLDTCCLDNLAPLLGAFDDDLVKFSRRSDKHGAGQVVNPRGDLRINKSSVYLLIKLIDDCDGRILRSSDANPSGDLIPWQEVAEDWNV